jgi:hypothetical protein
VLKKVQEACEQLAKRNLVHAKLHRDILTSDWSYVRAVALPMIPNLEGWEKAQPKLHQVMCSYCRQFVLDQKKFDDLAGWLSFLKRQSPIVYPADEQYENLLTRIIGSLLVSNSDPFFSRLSLNEKLSKSRKLNEEAVVGCRTSKAIIIWAASRLWSFGTSHSSMFCSLGPTR